MRFVPSDRRRAEYPAYSADERLSRGLRFPSSAPPVTGVRLYRIAAGPVCFLPSRRGPQPRAVRHPTGSSGTPQPGSYGARRRVRGGPADLRRRRRTGRTDLHPLRAAATAAARHRLQRVRPVDVDDPGHRRLVVIDRRYDLPVSRMTSRRLAYRNEYPVVCAADVCKSRMTSRRLAYRNVRRLGRSGQPQVTVPNDLTPTGV